MTFVLSSPAREGLLMPYVPPSSGMVDSGSATVSADGLSAPTADLPRPARNRGFKAPLGTPGSQVALPVRVRSGRRFHSAIGHIVLAVVALCSIFPIYWMFVTALRPPEQALSTSPVPWPLSLENLRYVVETIPIIRMLAMTFAMALALAVCQTFIAILAAYAFAVWEFRGKRVLFLAFIGSWLIPFQVTMIPNYVAVAKLGLLNSVLGVIVPQLCTAFGVLLLRQHMQAFPRDLLDAARIDGRSSWGTLWRVVVPNLKPALSALGVMLFVSAWNEYLWPSLILQHSDALVQVGVRSFLGVEGDHWGAVMAGAALACLPVFVVYLFLRRHVVEGFIRSGIK